MKRRTPAADLVEGRIDSPDGGARQNKGKFKDPYADVSNQISDEAIENKKNSLYRISKTTLEVTEAFVDVLSTVENNRVASGTGINGNQEISSRPAPVQIKKVGTNPVLSTVSENPYKYSATTSSASDQDGSSGVFLPPPVSNPSASNRRSGFTYDDTNHSHCLSIQAARRNSGSRMAYGHYQMTNNCSYPITAQICTVSDNADGSPSDTWTRFQDGAACPGGWGGAAFKAGETRTSRTWFEFRQIKFRAYICREGWSIVNMQDKTVYLIGERFRCRIYR